MSEKSSEKSGEKKMPERFTIQFDRSFYDHWQAMQMLNNAGRRKADLIAKALAVYAQYEAGTLPPPPQAAFHTSNLSNTSAAKLPEQPKPIESNESDECSDALDSAASALSRMFSNQ
jgi:spore coat protein CotH